MYCNVVCVYIYIYICIRICIYIYIYIYIHVYTYYYKTYQVLAMACPVVEETSGSASKGTLSGVLLALASLAYW